jgi:hypothetical protein
MAQNDTELIRFPSNSSSSHSVFRLGVPGSSGAPLNETRRKETNGPPGTRCAGENRPRHDLLE